MKRLIVMLLCLLMVVSVFSGCGPATPAGTTDGNNGTTGNVADDTLPEDIKLTIGIPMNAQVVDYNTNAYTLFLEEVTGYDLEIQVYQTAAADYKSQLSVAMVDGEKLPDILLGFYLGEAVYEEYGEDGYLLDLAPYFNDKEGKAKVWWDRFNVYETEDFRNYILNTMVADDGGIYCFPHLESSRVDANNHQVYINTTWLKNLNLEMPKDPESLYTVLKAFKEQDPNGNGLADEIPLMGTGGSSYGHFHNWLMNMFTYVSKNNEYFWRVDEQGKLYHVYTSDEYREGLKYINKLVTEGLLPASSWTTKNPAMKGAMSAVDGVQKVGIAVGHAVLIFPDDCNIEEYEPLPYWGNVTFNDPMNNWCCFITADCEYPDAAWNVLMAMTSEVGAISQLYGQKGVDWDYADPGAASYSGNPAVVKVINADIYGGMNNSCWHHTMGSIFPDPEPQASQSDPFEFHRNTIMYTCTKYAYDAAENNPDNIAAKVIYSTVATEAVKTVRTNSKNWINNARTSFCCGTGDQFNNPNDDAQWKAYCDGLLEQGIEDWLKVEQKLYNEQYGD